MNDDLLLHHDPATMTANEKMAALVTLDRVIKQRGHMNQPRAALITRAQELFKSLCTTPAKDDRLGCPTIES